MGIFSFLTGKNGESTAPEAVANEAERASGGGSADVPDPSSPSGPEPAGERDTPFAPPGAWDMDTAALTAPPAPSSAKNEPEVGPVDPEKTAALQGPIIEVIKTVYDPEIPVDIYELGLIYDIVVDAGSNVLVRMTLTSPACPSAQQLPSEVRYKVKAVEGVTDAAVEVVWEPPWDKDRMSEAARLSLGFF